MRIVASMATGVRVSAGGVFGLGHHFVWCRKLLRPVCIGWNAAFCEELIRARVGGHGWPVVALGIMPDRVHLFVKAHSSDSPSQIASPFKDLPSRRLQSGFPHLRSGLPTLWSRSYCEATADAAPAETGCRFTGRQDGRPWGKERAR